MNWSSSITTLLRECLPSGAEPQLEGRKYSGKDDGVYHIASRKSESHVFIWFPQKSARVARVGAGRQGRPGFLVLKTRRGPPGGESPQEQGWEIRVMGPPPEVREGCDLVVEFPLGRNCKS
jgi:hypothetical protein